MIKKSVLRKFIAGLTLLGVIGLLSACGGGGGGGDAGGTNTSAPTLALFAGNMGGAGTADGTGAAARFDFPGSVATDSSGNIYVADSNNNTIRKITPGKVVTTLAGTAGVTGIDDGTGASASFDLPSGVATDSAGNVYVADQNNSTIRKITPAGVVTTLAGTAGVTGSADGTGAAASFSYPFSVATDSNGNVYVADSTNHIIRKIVIATGVVTTLAGTAGVTGSADATGAAASFDYPSSVATDGAGNVYVADSNNSIIRKITPAGVVTTLAGTAGVTGGDDGTGAAASFDTPSGVTTDNAGNVYVADSYNNTIRKITPAGAVTTLAGTAYDTGSANGTGAAASFDTPSGVATDSNGNLYVADSYNNTIRKIVIATGVVTTQAGTATVTGSADGTVVTASFNLPSGVAIDSLGNVYVADQNNSTIRKISTVGNVTTLAGTAGVAGGVDGTGAAASFRYPNGVATDSADNVYVADSSNNTIRMITPSGVVTTLAGTAGAPGNADGTGAAARFSYPSSVATDSAGNVYVSDQNNNTIRKITPAGEVTTLAGTAGVTGSADGTGVAASFDTPSGVATDSAGNVYVSDQNNHTIRKITPAGVVTTLAGAAGVTGGNDGTGAAASFDTPSGVATDSSGNVYVADQNNHTIRKITPAGVVSTVVGLAGQPGFTTGALPGMLNYPVGVAIGGTSLYIVTGGGVAVVKNVP